MGDLPEYLELRELGTGSQGRVVLARHNPSGLVVAVKYLHGADASAVERFRDEAVLLQRVGGPHVAALHEFREFPGGAAIIMEAVDGTSLRALLDAHGALTPEAALTVLKGSLLGLESAHRLGIVHRDYKPANVIVTSEGQSKLIDFGVAVFAGSRGGSGTPAYMAPEQWTRNVSTPATDVYAATCVFFECVTGRRPFREGLLADLHRWAPIPVEEVPEPLRGLVARGMAKEASERPPSAQSFVAELEAAAATAYGPDWESHGRAVLGGMAAGMLGGAALSAMAGTTTATTAATTAGTGLGSTVLGGASLTVVGAVLGVAVTAGVGVFTVQKLTGDKPSPPPVVTGSAPPKPSLAYMTNSAVMVNGPDGRSRRITSLSGRAPGYSLAWSSNGEWLGWTTAPAGTPHREDRLHLASVGGGEVRSWTCPDEYCGKIDFRGDQLVLVPLDSDARPRLLLYPHDGGDPAGLPVTGLPKDPYLDNYGIPNLEAATEDTVILSHGVGTSAYGGPVAYYRVSETGQATKLFDDGGNVAPRGTRVTPDGKTLVYTGARRGGYCEHYENVVFATLATGRVETPQMPSGYVTVSGVWHDASGVVRASFLPKERTCPDVDPAVPDRPAVFELRAGAWVPDGRSVLDSGFSEDGSEATLTGRIPPGTLTVSRDGKTTTVKDVSLFAWSS
ncbi:serine/threonine-protein kinase [Actinocorallia sp. B10E7]|uniref:serine/threonine-protein kinase n=1 Tax=Actinocorallia sp. B10E7 TaxID=3153558 RepID=UPI00325EE601